MRPSLPRLSDARAPPTQSTSSSAGPLGFRRAVEVDTGLAAGRACDGDLPLGVLIDAVADLLDVDLVALRADLTPRLRRLIAATPSRAATACAERSRFVRLPFQAAFAVNNPRTEETLQWQQQARHGS